MTRSKAVLSRPVTISYSQTKWANRLANCTKVTWPATQIGSSQLACKLFKISLKYIFVPFSSLKQILTQWLFNYILLLELVQFNKNMQLSIPKLKITKTSLEQTQHSEDWLFGTWWCYLRQFSLTSELVYIESTDFKIKPTVYYFLVEPMPTIWLQTAAAKWRCGQGRKL